MNVNPGLLAMQRYEQFAKVIARSHADDDARRAELEECLRCAHVVATHADATDSDEARAELVKVLCELLALV